LNKKTEALSGGQKRKVCLMLSLLGNTEIVLLDEPTTGLDVQSRRSVWEVIKRIKNNRVVILTTHNMDEADFLADRIAIMSDG
jgi:ATP-binding cassette subfamily A (ABC1) protein 3